MRFLQAAAARERRRRPRRHRGKRSCRGVRPRAAAMVGSGISDCQPFWPATKRRGGARALQRCPTGAIGLLRRFFLQRGALRRGGARELVDKAVCVGRAITGSHGGVGVCVISHASGTPLPLRRRLGPIRGETAGSPPRGSSVAAAFQNPSPHRTPDDVQPTPRTPTNPSRKHGTQTANRRLSPPRRGPPMTNCPGRP